MILCGMQRKNQFCHTAQTLQAAAFVCSTVHRRYKEMLPRVKRLRIISGCQAGVRKVLRHCIAS